MFLSRMCGGIQHNAHASLVSSKIYVPNKSSLRMTLTGTPFMFYSAGDQIEAYRYYSHSLCDNWVAVTLRDSTVIYIDPNSSCTLSAKDTAYHSGPHMDKAACLQIMQRCDSARWVVGVGHSWFFPTGSYGLQRQHACPVMIVTSDKDCKLWESNSYRDVTMYKGSSNVVPFGFDIAPFTNFPLSPQYIKCSHGANVRLQYKIPLDPSPLVDYSETEQNKAMCQKWLGKDNACCRVVNDIEAATSCWRLAREQAFQCSPTPTSEHKPNAPDKSSVVPVVEQPPPPPDFSTKYTYFEAHELQCKLVELVDPKDTGAIQPFPPHLLLDCGEPPAPDFSSDYVMIPLPEVDSATGTAYG
eukprot:TRINITY_DN66706_c7_g1_i1.p1 TRINITY_DN66706_c7_g1~~TRINITY_DN66706_c7_g1_i1.p1  ORF type:complete len:356 (+),score=28.32 TRINITY_DN66706_c7_g1_i1:1-1068(+)